MIKLFLSILLACCCLFVQAQQTPQKFTSTLHYLLYLPQNYNANTDQKWPLMVFLHGSGESGSDLEIVKKNGPPMLIAQGKQFPMIIVSPQAASAQVGWETEELYHLILDLEQKYKIDPDRIYLTGLSMGGFGTWALAIRHPELFAAIAPVCGGGDTSNIWRLRNIPTWCFHGKIDDVVPMSKDTTMIHALRHYQPGAKLTLYPGVGHNAWTNAYNDSTLYTWMLSQRKYHRPHQQVSPKVLAKYAGSYIGNGGDVYKVTATNDTLKIHKNHNNDAVLLAETQTMFHYEDEDDGAVSLEFTKGGMILWGDKKYVFKRMN